MLDWCIQIVVKMNKDPWFYELKKKNEWLCIFFCFPSWNLYFDSNSGIYVCSNCDNELFHSQTKYNHSSPWPAFTHLIREDSVSRVKESATAIKVLRNGIWYSGFDHAPLSVTRGPIWYITNLNQTPQMIFSTLLISISFCVSTEW